MRRQGSEFDTDTPLLTLQDGYLLCVVGVLRSSHDDLVHTRVHGRWAPNHRAGHDATVQFDFNQPERFDLGYIGADGRRHRVVMIHRGTVGSMERVVAALLERYQGRLPFWLAPVQVAVLPVAEDQDPAARDLADRLRADGRRAVVLHDGPLGARIREARLRRHHLIAVLGRQEAVAGESITLTLAASESAASATLHNQGSTIEEDLLERIFELGVSDPSLPAPMGESEHRGQGLFVAKTYMAKMGGTINARNTEDGVAFTLTFQRLG